MPYFQKLFPSLRIQKPGVDYYGSTTLLLAFICIYIFKSWGQVSVDNSVLLESYGENNNLFKGDMTIMLISFITIMIAERFVSRADTKAVDQKSLASVNKK